MVTTNELRDKDSVSCWLTTGLALRRTDIDHSHTDIILRVINSCAHEMSTLPPVGFIADITELLYGSRLNQSYEVSDEKLSAALSAYSNDILSRLIASAQFDDLIVVFSKLPEERRALAAALIISAICRHTGLQGTQVSPGTLRTVMASIKAVAVSDYIEDDNINQLLAKQYFDLARGGRHCKAIVDEHDVFVISNLHHLTDSGARMTLLHIASAADAIMQSLPRRIKSGHSKRGEQDTKMTDDLTYPAGGFSSIIAGGMNGNIENLVTSELVYMEDDEAVDLFSLRYIEGELLMYTRDDSVFRRRHHTITIALDPDLVNIRVKDRDLPWQRIILALGFIVAMIRYLNKQLSDQALLFRICFPPKVLTEELGIVALLLDSEIVNGSVVITEESWEDTVAKIQAISSGTMSDTIVLSHGKPLDLPRQLRSTSVNLTSQFPSLGNASADTTVNAMTAWQDVAEDLLHWVV